MSHETIPAGWRQNAQGGLTREDMIKPIDQTRDQLVRDIVAKAKDQRALLAKFKADAFADIAAFVQLSAEQYNAQVGGKKGNVTLVSFCGRWKIIRAIAETITFDERLQAAKAIIDECLREWTENARDEIRTLVNDAFRVDQAGNVRVGQVLRLRSLNITDERWMEAMTAIADAIQVTGSKSYVRIYERIGDTDRYAPISLDIAGV